MLRGRVTRYPSPSNRERTDRSRLGFAVLFLIAAASVALAVLLKNHAFGADVDTDGTMYTRVLLLSIVMAVWLVLKAVWELGRGK
jgi:hypothetical protein